MVTCCPCVAFGEVVGSLPPGSMSCAGDARGACFAYLLFFCEENNEQRGIEGDFIRAASALGEASLLVAARRTLRRQLGIAEPTDWLESDTFAALCCTRPSLCQEVRELRAAHRRGGAAHGVARSAAPKTQVMLL